MNASFPKKCSAVPTQTGRGCETAFLETTTGRSGWSSPDRRSLIALFWGFPAKRTASHSAAAAKERVSAKRGRGFQANDLREVSPRMLCLACSFTNDSPKIFPRER